MLPSDELPVDARVDAGVSSAGGVGADIGAGGGVGRGGVSARAGVAAGRAALCGSVGAGCGGIGADHHIGIKTWEMTRPGIKESMTRSVIN